MTRDELEFAISQYLDGALAGADLAALESRLATDAEARGLLAEYRKLDVALKAAPLPAVNWDRFAAQICGAVAEQQEAPVTTYRIGSFRTVARLALAACVLVGIGFGIRLLQRSQTDSSITAVVVKPQKAPTEIIVVDARPAGPAVSNEPIEPVAIGPAAGLGDNPRFAGYQDDVISRPSQVLIARSGQAAHDGSFLP